MFFRLLNEFRQNFSEDDQASDALHREAFRNQPLGQSLYPSWSNLQRNDIDRVDGFRKAALSNSIIVLGSGLDHKILESAAHRAFSDLKLTPVAKKTKYVGGSEVRISGDNLTTRVRIGFEGPGFGNTKEAVGLYVWAKVLGSYSRCSTNPPNPGEDLTSYFGTAGGKFPYLKWLAATNRSYSDAGLFFVDAVADPSADKAENLTRDVALLLKEAAGSLSEQQLSRAQNVLLARLLHKAESNAGKFELLLHTANSSSVVAVSPSDLADTIRGLSLSDLSSIANKVIAGKPTVIASGSVHALLPL